MENSEQSTPSPQASSDPEVLLWAEYPGGQFQAAVQSDGQSIYFVIQGDDQRLGPPRWTWVRNLVDAPVNFSKRSEDSFRPALLPSSYCAHPSGAPALDLEKTQIVWMEQGCGAALVEDKEVIALIPPLLQQNLPGYAKDCLHQSQISLPLEGEDEYKWQVSSCIEYWNTWADSQKVEKVYQDLSASVSNVFGTVEGHFGSGSEGGWPHVLVQKFSWKDKIVLATAGVSVRKQPSVENQLQNYEDHQRMELAMLLDADVSEELLQLSMNRLLTTARYPWFIQTCFLPLQTFQWHAPLDQGLSSAAFYPESTVSEKMDRQPVTLPSYRKLPVNLLWICPHPIETKPDRNIFELEWKQSQFPQS